MSKKTIYILGICLGILLLCVCCYVTYLFSLNQADLTQALGELAENPRGENMANIFSAVWHTIAR
jgi:hypothetical protein